MKISELQKKLEYYKKLHGDIEVVVWEYNYGDMDVSEMNKIYVEDGELILST